MECCDDLAGVEGERAVSIAILQVLEEKIRLRNEKEEARDLSLCGFKQEGVGRWWRRRRWSAVVRRKQPTWRMRSKRKKNLWERDLGIGAMD